MAAVTKLCKADDNNEKCHNEATAMCHHCSRDLCLDHIIKHAQLLDANNHAILKDYFSILTDLSSKIESLLISTNILNDPFVKIKQWGIEAHHQIDEIIEQKCQEIETKINDYRQIFNAIRTEQLDKITRYKQKIADLFRETQIANKAISNLERSIKHIQNDLNIFNEHKIEVTSNRPLIHSINIRMHVDNWKPSNCCSSSSSSTSSSVSSILHQLEFRLKYVRLSGIVTCHYILVEVNGTIGDLIDKFIAIQEKTLMIKQKRDSFLAVEANQYRVRQRFQNDIQLKSIFNKIDQLILYETPFELNINNLQQYCLILCRFQDGLPWDIQFGLPILLQVPRFQCRGRNVIDALNKTLKTCFPLLIDDKNNIHYEVKIVSNDHQMNEATLLDLWADKIIDDYLLMADNETLIVNLINNNEILFNDQTTRLARLDGTLKTTEKRRKSRK
ncbi:unnamed protein product [Adineta steineri]|uniref:Uncharacterized protein n=1 Tax=Adineta steineri TaxID=433720 RepID=A0A813NI89_9BILA|nr:unnamed protein product [Adineta steineri]CAF0746606.1 unnamed protein product [Adineta steineri]